MMVFILGAFVGAFVSWIAWDNWAFGWTAKHQLRADLFTLPRDEVFEELAFVTRARAHAAGVMEHQRADD